MSPHDQTLPHPTPFAEEANGPRRARQRLHWSDDEIEAAMSFDFADLRPLEVPVRIPVKEGKFHPDGAPRDFVLKEATADVARIYRNAQMRSTKLVDGKPAQIDGFADADLLLLHGCLFEVLQAPAAGAQPALPPHGVLAKSFISSLPNRVSRPLIAKCKHISGLNDDESIESLERQRKSLDEKIAQMRKERKGSSAEGGEGDQGGEGGPAPKGRDEETTSSSA